jgi:hypothetical protein
MNNDTPRTDKFVATWDFYNDPFESIDHARTLERELTAATEQRDQWKNKYIQQNKDLGHELRDSNETIWSECALANVRLTHKHNPERTMNEEENDTEAELAAWELLREARLELTAVTEQRDRLLEQQEQWRLSSVCRELIEQRDRLAEALIKCREDSVCEQVRMEKCRYTKAADESQANIDRADKALQYLNQSPNNA